MVADVSTVPEAKPTLLKRTPESGAPTQADIQYHWMMAWFIGGLLLGDIVLAQIAHFRRLDTLLDCLPTACLLGGIACYCDRRNFGRCKEISVLAMWVVLATNALSLLVQVAGRVPSPFVDSSLAGLDRLMGASTGEVVAWVLHYPLLQQLLWASYQSIPVLVLASLLLPTTFGYYKESRCYVFAVTITGIIISAIFACWPALGPWTIYHFPPTKSQQVYISYLNLLRSTQPITLDLGASGIVTFPSFHTALAVHSAVALWNVKYVRYFAALLSAAVCASTITTGWHYFSDVLGGATLALVSIAIARWSMNRPMNAAN